VGKKQEQLTPAGRGVKEQTLNLQGALKLTQKQHLFFFLAAILIAGAGIFALSHRFQTGWTGDGSTAADECACSSSTALALTLAEETGKKAAADKYPKADPEKGHIEGVVILKGAAPKLEAVPGVPANNRDKAICEKHFKDERLVLGKDNAIRDVVLTLADMKKSRKKPKAKTIQLNNKGCLFSPHIVAMAVGSTLEVVNSDSVLHNTRAVLEMNFNRAIGAGQSFKERARKEGFALVQCDFHPWMNAQVHILPHAYFDVSDAGGKFKIMNIPPGTYTLEARHEVLAPFFVEKKPLKKVTIKKGETLKLTFEIEAPKE
jgi:plastocyanin